MNLFLKSGTAVKSLLLITVSLYITKSVNAQGQLPLKAAFTQDKTMGCSPLLVQFSDKSTGNITSYYWDFGNGNTSALKNPGALYHTAGNYTVKLIITDGSGESDTLIKTLALKAIPNPQAGFTVSSLKGCAGQELQFTDTSKSFSGNIASWQWNFGDGGASTLKNPGHIYTADGSFSVSLIVTDSNGCKSFVNRSSYITTSKPAQVRFIADNTGGCTLPHTAKFSDTSITDPAQAYSYKWHFGNGDSATGKNPTMSYAQAGNFDVTLTLKDNNNCVSSHTQKSMISLGKTKADFELNAKKGCAPHAVEFTNTSTGLAGNANVVWYFGNGDSAAGINAAYTYSKPGTYSVKMVITSPQGCNDSVVKKDSITVLPTLVSLFGHLNTVSCTVPHTVDFSSGNKKATSWKWDFGDGSASALANPSHTYTQGGVYTVSLTITDSNGCQATASKKNIIRVKSQHASFVPSINKGCAPLTVNFINQSSSAFPITSYKWEYGGPTYTTSSGAIVYTQPGVYHPRLVITDANGCMDTVVYDSIRVGAKTKPSFSASATSGCRTDMGEVKFTNNTDTVSQQIDEYFWNFGTLTSDAKDPVVDYSSFPGKFSVYLITKQNGCPDTAFVKDYMSVMAPQAKMKIVEDPCKLDTVTFENSSIAATDFTWSLNGQTASTSPSFKQWLAPGKYTALLKVYNDTTGCRDSIEYTLTIRKPLNPGFVQTADSVCTYTHVMFTDTTQGAVTTRWIYDGANVSGKILTHQFIFPKTLDITMQVYNEIGCREEITLPLKVLGPDFIPAVTPDKGCFPLDAKLVKTGSTAHGIKSVQWSDGITNIFTTADSVPFTFKTAHPTMNTRGIDVTLTVEDTLGCRVSRVATVKLSKPAAGISAVQVLNCDNTVLKFSPDNSASKNINALDYQWITSTGQSHFGPSHQKVFSKEAAEKLKLIVVEKELGCKDSTTTSVVIGLKDIKAGFTADKTSTTCPPLISTFADNSKVKNTTITSVSWSFGDGGTSSMVGPSKTYFYPGKFDIIYKVTDAAGCSDSIVVKEKINVGGPTGTYTIDRYTGCIPFESHFSAQTQNTSKVQWDMGNGALNKGATTKTTYTLPGTYKPALVLEDASGCLVVYPVKDPIVALASPSADFTFDGKCVYDEFSFTNVSDTASIPAKYEWAFGDANPVSGFHAKHTFKNSGGHPVILKATATNGCVSESQRTVKVNMLKAGFETSSSTVCVTEQVKLTDKTTSDAGIAGYQWILGDGRVETSKNPSFYYGPGEFSISLVVKDNDGCFDTLNDYKKVVVMDTLAPPSPVAHRVTVEESNTIRLEFAPNTQADFGNYLVYRGAAGNATQQYAVISGRYDTVFTDAKVNTHALAYTYKVYSQSYCGKTSVGTETNAHTTVLLRAAADTNAVVVNWSRYEGWEKVGNYHIFRQEAGKNNWSKIATVSGKDTSYTDRETWCGYTYNYHVFAEKADALPLVSRSNNVVATPVYKATAQPGEIVRATVENDQHVQVEFKELSVAKVPVSQYIVEKSVDGVNFSEFATTNTIQVLNDLKTNVDEQSYYYRVSIQDICGATSIPGNKAKTIVIKASVDANDNISATWNAYQVWKEGIAHYEIEFQNADGTFTKAGTNHSADTSYTEAFNLFNHVQQACYRIKAVSNNGTVSYSNVDCVKGRSTLFVPNAFTPNADGLNNKFAVVGAYIKRFEMNIYDRYGEKIFTTDNLEDGWDGTYKNQPVSEGVYVYVITSLGMDNKFHNLSGNITLLR
ncbi:MAG TPA: PKD domain-containing protein [Bacteroidia bacterium]|nr:PKD domain-containing protein [Bacteroidia bacterium]